MQNLDIATPVANGRRQRFAQNIANTSPIKPGNQPEPQAVNRWAVYRDLCIAKAQFDINDRCLAVLNALLSFYPDNEISEKHGFVVFPSNRQLALRAHGMPASTLRRHLATLVSAGLITRHDSPNCKRYAHKDKAGEVEEAYGFGLAPLITRAAEFHNAAEQIEAAARKLKLLRDRITIQRRELTRIIAEQLEHKPENEFWQQQHCSLRAIIERLPRKASLSELEAILAEMTTIAGNVDNYLFSKENDAILSTSSAQNERHHIESLPESHFEYKSVQKNELIDFPKPGSRLEPSEQPDCRPALAVLQGKSEPTSAGPQFREPSIQDRIDAKTATIPLDMVLRACPDIKTYAPQGIASWRDLVTASQLVARFLGITQSAYNEAMQVMGFAGASTTIAWILQRIGEISSAGGYLRSLTQKARAGGFSIQTLLLTNLKGAEKMAVH